MLHVEKTASLYFENNFELNMSKKDENHFQNCDICWFCDLPIEKKIKK